MTHCPQNAPARNAGTLAKAEAQAELAAAVELSHAEWLRLKGRLPWVEFRDDGDALGVFAGEAWPRNTIAHARFSPDSAQGRVGEILARHLKEKVACHWIVGPLSQPADLEQHLRAHGFRCVLRCVGMACDLVAAVQKVPKPDGVVIGPANEPQALLRLSTERRRARQRGRSLLSSVKPKQVWNFAASIGEQSVGEATLFTAGGVAGLYNVEVNKEFRGRGIGAAVVQAALDKARELGFSAAVLGATVMGQGVYARLGFGEVCKLSIWKYGKMRQRVGS